MIVCEGPSRLDFTSTIGENVTTISRGLLPTGQMAEVRNFILLFFNQDP